MLRNWRFFVNGRLGEFGVNEKIKVEIVGNDGILPYLCKKYGLFIFYKVLKCTACCS